MKIIDLLNKIANGEEAPKRIKYENEIRDYDDGDKDYICIDSKNYFLFYDVLTKGTGEKFKKALNDEVEIIEEDNKIEENNKRIINTEKLQKDLNNKIEYDRAISLLVDYINISYQKLIDEVNKLKEEK